MSHRPPRTRARSILLAVVLVTLLPGTAKAQSSAPGGSSSDAGTPETAGKATGEALTSETGAEAGTTAVVGPDGGTPSAHVAPGTPPKRPHPDYEGREPESHATEDALLFVPRVVLFPIYLVAEYAVAVPVGALATTAEEKQWPKAIHDALTFGPNQEGGIYPTFLIDFGLRPSIGFHLFWGFLPVNNRISLDSAWGGAQWWTVAIADRQEFSKNETLVTELRWDRRPDNPFYGIGPEAPNDLRSRVGTDVLQASLTWKRILGPLTLRAGGSVRRLDFKDFTCCGDPALKERVEQGQVPPPPGYEQPYTAAGGEVAAVLDTRRPDIANQSGWRVALGAAPSVDLQRGGRLSWLRYAAGVEGNWDVTGNARVLSLGVITAFVDPLGSEPVPFTELVMLGGNEPFAGYLPGRLRDRSAIVAQLGWHWPVFSYLDGLLAVSVGNVFGPHLQDFSFDLLRLSAELGLGTRRGSASGFEFVIGIGSEPFRNFSISSFRLAFGVSYGP
jgi:hypothetical protein